MGAGFVSTDSGTATTFVYPDHDAQLILGKSNP